MRANVHGYLGRVTLLCLVAISLVIASCQTGTSPLAKPAPVPTWTPLPDDHDPHFTGYPISGPARRGVPYRFSIYSHCGVDYDLDFDGSYWQASSTGGRLTSLGFNDTSGILIRTDEDSAVFIYPFGRIPLVRHPGLKAMPGCE